MFEEGGYQSGCRGEKTDADSQAVYPINQIESVRATNQPNCGDRDSTPGRQMSPDDSVYLDASQNRDASGGELSREFLPGLQTAQVVHKTRKKNDRGGRAQISYDVEVLPNIIAEMEWPK
jgi:hypothetical protein